MKIDRRRLIAFVISAIAYYSSYLILIEIVPRLSSLVMIVFFTLISFVLLIQFILHPSKFDMERTEKVRVNKICEVVTRRIGSIGGINVGDYRER